MQVNAVVGFFAIYCRGVFTMRPLQFSTHHLEVDRMEPLQCPTHHLEDGTSAMFDAGSASIRRCRSSFSVIPVGALGEVGRARQSTTGVDCHLGWSVGGAVFL
jgi:hypothetical protein